MITKEATNPIDMVVEFMNTAGQTVRTVPTYEIPEEGLRFDLIREEIYELLIDGFKSNNFIEIIDACADIVYVVCGAAATYGVGAVGSGQELTMRIIRPEASAVRAFDAVNDFKTERDNLVIDLVSYLEVLQDAKTSSIIRDMQFVTSPDPRRAGDYVERLVVVWEDIIACCYMIAGEYGVNLDLVLDEVQASNMSKFGPNLEVYRRDDGKVMKGPDYFKPDIARVLADQGVEGFVESK